VEGNRVLERAVHHVAHITLSTGLIHRAVNGVDMGSSRLQGSSESFLGWLSEVLYFSAFEPLLRGSHDK